MNTVHQIYLIFHLPTREMISQSYSARINARERSPIQRLPVAQVDLTRELVLPAWYSIII